MKTRLTPKARKLASALLTTLVICSILSIFVLYYLSLIDQQNFLSARSQSWNMAIVISEAGIEDGMEQLNVNYPNLGSDGWSYDSSSSSYSRSNYINSDSSYVSTIIVTNSLNPLVVARAYVSMPSKYGKAAVSSVFATIGASQTTPTSGPVTRAVAVTTSKGNFYLAALVARNNINLKGNGVTTDSYDSTDPTKSTNSHYDPAKYKGDHGDVATDLSVMDSLSVGNANIYGHAHTGPNSPANAISYLPNCVVGSHSWATSNSGIEPGWYVQDANFSFPNTALPNTVSYLTPTNGTVVLKTGTMTTNSTYSVLSTAPNLASTVWQSTYTSGLRVGQTYYYAVLSGYTTNTYDQIVWGPGNYVVGSAGKVLVLGSDAVLVVTNGLTGSESFQIYSDAWNTNGATPSFPDSSITVYAGGTSTSVTGNQIVNQTGVPAAFTVFSAPTVTSVSFGGNAGFNGILVAPNADLSMNGSGSTVWDFCGAIMANSITLNGHFNFHYDESLARGPRNGRFLITAWNEVN